MVRDSEFLRQLMSLVKEVNDPLCIKPEQIPGRMRGLMIRHRVGEDGRGTGGGAGSREDRESRKRKSQSKTRKEINMVGQV
jgi:hypothetical protein